MSTLYQLTDAYQELLSMALDPDVDPEALADTMEAIDGEFEDKVESYIITIEDVKANAAILDSEEKQRRLEHKIVGLEWLIKQNEQFARIGRAIVKWRNRNGQD